MRNYYQSTIDFSELRFLIDDTLKIEADNELKEAGLLTSKDKPASEVIRETVREVSAPFLNKLRRVMERRGGVEPVRDQFLNLYNNKEYTGFFLLLVIEYGLLNWQTPKIIVMLPAAPAALKEFEAEFLVVFNEFIENSYSAGDSGDENT